MAFRPCVRRRHYLQVDKSQRKGVAYVHGQLQEILIIYEGEGRIKENEIKLEKKLKLT